MYVKIRQGTRTAYNLSKFLVDDISEISSLPKSPMGSTVYAIHDKASFMADSEGTWYPIDTEHDAIKCDCNCVSELTIWQELEESND